MAGPQRFRVIAETLAEEIRQGSLAPGAQLPTSRELMTRFDVCRSTINYAMRLLEQRGLIRGHSGKGVFVSDDQDRLSGVSPDVFRLGETWDGARHIYVAQFTSGLGKVGKTQDPQRRLRRLERRVRLPIRHAWVSPCHLEAADNENALIAFATERYILAQPNFEFFRNVDFDALVEFAARLPMTAWQGNWVAVGHLLEESA